jgi:hypothetical protein
MRKRWYIVICLLVIGVGAWFILAPREPYVEGKRLSDWIQLSQSGKAPERETAHLVLHNLGTNHVPILLAWLEENPEQPPGWKERMKYAYLRVDVWLKQHHLTSHPLPGAFSNEPFRMDHFGMALQALPELRPEVKNFAIPLLTERLGDKNEWVIAGALLALPKMVPESIPALIQCVSSGDSQVRAAAADLLGEIGPEAKSAVPTLKSALTDDNPEVRLAAAGSLGKLGCDPALFLPVVIQSLDQAGGDNLDYQLEILARYPNGAKAAVPLLLAILNRTAASTNAADLATHNQVLSTLQSIEPKAAAGVARPGPK